jgi:hypothetical protein
VVIVCLNNAEVEVDSRDHEGTDRNEKESQPLAIFPTDAPRQRFRAPEAPGTPAKAYERRVANQGLRTILKSWPTWPDKSQANGCTTLMQQLAEGLATGPCDGAYCQARQKCTVQLRIRKLFTRARTSQTVHVVELIMRLMCAK